MPSVKSKANELKSFLNAKHSIELPSNLLTKTKREQISKTVSPANHSKRNSSKYATTARYFREIDQIKTSRRPVIIEQNNQTSEKNVLYKRLSGIRSSNARISNLSFSKLLSRMVIIGQDEQANTNVPFQFRMRQTTYARPLKQKNMQLDMEELARKTQRSISRASQYSQKIMTDRSYKESEKTKQHEKTQREDPSRKLFKKYYLPHSQMAQTMYLQTINPDDKYVYQNGKRVECKRIHNFYTSNMFRRGYDRCFRKNSEGCSKK